MTLGNLDEPIFSATLVPCRSLGRTGFLAVIGSIAAISFFIGAFFCFLGAWPVIGFVGLDVLAILLAFHLNYRAARAYEEVKITRAPLILRRVSPGGRVQELRFNPRWVTLEVENAGGEGVQRIAIRTRERRAPVGSLLNPGDRASFARAFGAALAEARR